MRTFYAGIFLILTMGAMAETTGTLAIEKAPYTVYIEEGQTTLTMWLPVDDMPTTISWTAPDLDSLEGILSAGRLQGLKDYLTMVNSNVTLSTEEKEYMIESGVKPVIAEHNNDVNIWGLKGRGVERKLKQLIDGR